MTLYLDFSGSYFYVDSVYDEKKEKERSWEKKQTKLKDIEEARKKRESKQA